MEYICQENNSLQEENKLLRQEVEAKLTKLNCLQDTCQDQKKELEQIQWQVVESEKQLRHSDDLRSLLEKEKEQIKAQLLETILRNEEKQLLEQRMQISRQRHHS